MAQYTEAALLHDGDVDLERDEELVLRCQMGDPTAFAELYERYTARLTRFCLRRLHDHQEAEDVAQETFVRAWRALPRFAGDRRFYPWLTVIARNLCTDALRRRSRSAPVVDVDQASTRAHPVDSGPTTEEQIVAAADGELVHRALGRLNPRHRRVLELREGSDWSYKEIARFEGVEVSAIETLVWRARQALKREFEALSDSRPALGAVALVGTGAGALQRTRASVARHAGHLHPGRFRLRDAAAALVVTSALATSAALPSTGPGATTRHPSTDRPPASAPATVSAARTPVATGGVPGAASIRSGVGGALVATAAGGSGGTTDSSAASEAVGSRSAAGTSSGPGAPVPVPATAAPVGALTPAAVLAPVVSLAGQVVSAVTTVVGTTATPTGLVPVATGAVATLPGAVAGGVATATGPLATAVTGPLGLTTAASGTVGSVLGTR
ncbi:MAG TPA: sigma-70 family RNA polymerase sigma factor [Acidimicrobiales bacterium]|nr:sigma-70 family RNA polymerase sigma factor [Acidimicrobiales bacterium]